jgi:hypothetical protein
MQDFSGVDVMITIFRDFANFLRQKLAFFFKTNIMIKMFTNTNSSSSKERHFVAKHRSLFFPWAFM